MSNVSFRILTASAAGPRAAQLTTLVSSRASATASVRTIATIASARAIGVKDSSLLCSPRYTHNSINNNSNHSANSALRTFASRSSHSCTSAHLASASSLVVSRAFLYSNAKKSFARGTEEELKAREEEEKKASQEFLKHVVDGDGRNAPRLRDVERFLPSKKQLNEELPTAAELEKALREGKMDMYAVKPEKDEE